jgi:hypothetical protein
VPMLFITPLPATTCLVRGLFCWATSIVVCVWRLCSSRLAVSLFGKAGNRLQLTVKQLARVACCSTVVSRSRMVVSICCQAQVCSGRVSLLLSSAKPSFKQRDAANQQKGNAGRLLNACACRYMPTQIKHLTKRLAAIRKVKRACCIAGVVSACLLVAQPTFDEHAGLVPRANMLHVFMTPAHQCILQPACLTCGVVQDLPAKVGTPLGLTWCPSGQVVLSCKSR